ncbi:hypothetical protein [Zhongshania marina]|uniref:Uncharacterized protein n=1 Tax=Zhongshania marina TaxID=2304603 RepID=A0A2S4HC58_9GAMM|nr:hypothetical protein [Marortus luteolus]POP51550.1 hypothetical protein C0068_16570 [Marortus luteolus]
MHAETFTYDDVETAVCMMTALDDENYPLFTEHQHRVGIGQLRFDIINDCAKKLAIAYAEIIGNGSWETELCFDVEIIPALMQHLGESQDTIFLPQSVWNDAMRRIMWFAGFEAEMIKTYQLTLEDIGATEDALYSNYGASGCAEAVAEYGEKYDLDRAP